jgi:hypothetical protein
MCVHSPSRVPGSRQDETSPASTWRGDGAGGGGGAPSGRSRTTASAASATATPTAAVETKAVVQPGPCSSAANGSADSTCPSWPSRPVSWVISGTRRAGNQAVTTESTLMKVSASPAPTSTRAVTASGMVSATASSNCPAAMVSAPTTISRRPEPVQQQADGNLQGRVDQQLQHDEPGQHRRRGAEPLGRASSPATPKDVRCITPTV